MIKIYRIRYIYFFIEFMRELELITGNFSVIFIPIIEYVLFGFHSNMATS